MKKLFRNKKAVSPVIATVLMILVTMVGMTLLFAFVSSYSDNYKAGIGSSVMESLTVEDIWMSPSSQTYDNVVNITIYNVGKIDSKITSIYADGLALTENGNINMQETIAVGQHLTLSLNNPRVAAWDPNHEYTFRISTLRGSNFDMTYKPAFTG